MRLLYYEFATKRRNRVNTYAIPSFLMLYYLVEKDFLSQPLFIMKKST